MTTPKQELNQALNSMKYLANAEDWTIYKTPGGWYHVKDSTFNMILSAPTAKTLTLSINAYIDGYLQASRALKETIAINEQAAALQLEAVANDRDHLKALLERATEAITEILRNLN
jgi:hypothetical protein